MVQASLKSESYAEATSKRWMCAEALLPELEQADGGPETAAGSCLFEVSIVPNVDKQISGDDACAWVDVWTDG